MTILLIHGFGVTRDSYWYLQLRSLLESSGTKCVVPVMPESYHPQKIAWLLSIKKVFDAIEGEVVLVGHSLGTRAVLLFLEQYDVQVKACLLVGAFSNDIENGLRRDGIYGSFFDHEVDINLVKSRCGKFVVLHSVDDCSIPYEQGEQIAHDLGAKLMTESTRDHFTRADDAQIVHDQLTTIIGDH